MEHCQKHDYQEADEQQNSNGIMKTLSSFFSGKVNGPDGSTNTESSMQSQARITAMAVANSLSVKSVDAVES